MNYVFIKSGWNYYGGPGCYTMTMEELGIEDEKIYDSVQSAYRDIFLIRENSPDEPEFDIYEYFDWKSSEEREHPFEPYKKWGEV